MTEDVFRIVVAAAVALAALAFVVQAGVVIAVYRGSRKTQEKVNQFIGQAEPILAKIGPLIEDAIPILARIAPTIDRIVLRMSVFELQHRRDTPQPVVINEAVELAKTFGGTDGHKFVNGVLDKLAPQLRALEFSGRAS